MSDVKHKNVKSLPVGDLLHRACQRSDALFATLSGDAQMTPRQLSVLLAIAEGEQSSQTTLTTATAIDRSTMADNVKRLVKRGLVTRRRSRHDARAYDVTLTAAVRQRIAKVEPICSSVESTLLETLSKPERETLVRLLTKMTAAPLPREFEPGAGAAAIHGASCRS